MNVLFCDYVVRLAAIRFDPGVSRGRGKCRSYASSEGDSAIDGGSPCTFIALTIERIFLTFI